MCSLTWMLTPQGYEIFFNRDEQRTREAALSPQSFKVHHTQVMMPIDPVGQGSWIATNEFGLSVCLLNLYQGDIPKGILISRGQLVRALSASRNVQQVFEALNQLSLNQYAPFTLVIFDSELTRHKGHVFAMEWDGHYLNSRVLEEPVFSSGVDFDNVMVYREQSYLALIGRDQNVEPQREKHYQYHAHHHEDLAHLSPCMHRSDAKTVSFTHIEVKNKVPIMKYFANSPCLMKSNVSMTAYPLLVSQMSDVDNEQTVHTYNS
ncbi:NRDE family protein [Vibrio sp.]|nr:NRDE family protein [Vibrio sp.]